MPTEQKKRTHAEMAGLVASKLSKDELVELCEMLDGDGDEEFLQAINEETVKVAPEIFATADDREDKIPVHLDGEVYWI